MSDAFDRLWAPHRMAYLQGEGKPATTGVCPFCEMAEVPVGEGLILARGTGAFVVLNLFPYNPGHLMVVPDRHVSGYEELSAAQAHQVADLTQQAIRALQAVAGPGGFNVGLNLGAVAGAGIAAHLHQHVVPRWGGDTNFMPVVGMTRVLPQVLADTRDLLVAAWPV